ncbi:LacI family DNA-binding transcriptional regulator [Sporosarcina sp. P33]|uniref:LacI family DNA-binding transcriptional regulator n=1 Tax=Sporosarcina sp. P33 TaxID=1930764 RepID=UPI0018C8C69F|nr:LacI family DNA-binding transcriptional regulator [Sporosarcina sp. P33]
MKRVTIKDVAKHANVSPSTVSRVLNNYLHVKPEKRKKVEESIRILNFEPNEIARSLITKKTKTIGLIVDDITNPFFSESAKIVINLARSNGYEILIYDTSGESDIEQSLNFLINRNISGLLVGSASNEESNYNKLKSFDIPLVYFNREPKDNIFDSVTMDNKKASQIAVNYLVAQGHENIAFLSGPLKYSTYIDRLEGYKNALQQNNIPIKNENILLETFSIQKLENCLGTLLTAKDRPTAILASSDNIAITALSIISKLGLTVPDDVAVIGFDNISISSNPYINLSTISQQKSKMLSTALEILINKIESSEVVNTKNIKIEPILIKRKTT